jgi:hypothetical protein
MINTLDGSIEQMAKRFAPAGRELAPWPVSPGNSEEELAEVETRLGCQLPRTFRDAIGRYDFLRAVAGNVAMSHALTLTEWLVSPNVEPLAPHLFKWWGSGTRPANLLQIAQSDAHTFMLDTDDGAVLATWVDDPKQVPFRVARSFALFYQGLASVYLAGLGTDQAASAAAAVAEAVGGDSANPFWERFANRAA